MKQLRHTIQHHNLHMQAPVRLSHINLYHCDTPTSDVFPGHPYAKLIFVQKGSGQLHYENYNISFQAGTLILMNPERQKFSIEINENPTDIAILGIEYLYFLKKDNILEQPFVLHQCPSEMYSFLSTKSWRKFRDSHFLLKMYAATTRNFFSSFCRETQKYSLPPFWRINPARTARISRIILINTMPKILPLILCPKKAA